MWVFVSLSVPVPLGGDLLAEAGEVLGDTNTPRPVVQRGTPRAASHQTYNTPLHPPGGAGTQQPHSPAPAGTPPGPGAKLGLCPSSPHTPVASSWWRLDSPGLLADP